MSDRLTLHVIGTKAMLAALKRIARERHQREVRNLVAERKRRRWTQSTLAEIVGYHFVTVQYWEQCRTVPKAASMHDWREALR